MQNYTIRFASIKDQKKIMQFIDFYWIKNHILARNKELFEWQYKDGEQLNFVLAESETEILAILGFIKYGKSLEEDIMLALWKSNDKKNPFLGMELLEYLLKRNSQKVSCNGINVKTTKELYEFMGFQVQKMKHYYRLADREQYFVAKIEKKQITTITQSYQTEIKKIESITDLERDFDWEQYEHMQYHPHKSKEFILYRYFFHPTYTYIVMAIAKPNTKKSSSLMIMRKIEINHTNILRIVDWVGDYQEIIYLSSIVEKLLSDYQAEYIDFLEGGVEDNIMEQAGFIENNKKFGNIIPNYFEPYECSNIEIWYATKYKDKFAIFKADGDQDRPNK